MNGRFYVTTSDPRRLRTWQRVFGTDTLPVLSDRARFQAVPGRVGDMLAYDLDLAALLPWQRSRFAAYVARKYGWDYVTALAEVEGAVSWPIRYRTDLEIVQPTEQKRPSAVSLFGHTPRMALAV